MYPVGFYLGEINGRKLCQQGSLVIVKFHHITVFLLFPGGKWSKTFPSENFKVQRVT